MLLISFVASAIGKAKCGHLEENRPRRRSKVALRSAHHRGAGRAFGLGDIDGEPFDTARAGSE